jgi:hypothetical protein
VLLGRGEEEGTREEVGLPIRKGRSNLNLSPGIILISEAY